LQIFGRYVGNAGITALARTPVPTFAPNEGFVQHRPDTLADAQFCGWYVDGVDPTAGAVISAASTKT